MIAGYRTVFCFGVENFPAIILWLNIVMRWGAVDLTGA